jgi:hypothetical protein
VYDVRCSERMVTNDKKAEMVDEAELGSPNGGLDEAVGKKPGDPFSTRA